MLIHIHAGPTWQQQARDIADNGFRVPAGHLSIHSLDSRRFLEAVVQPDDWYKQVVEHGYRPALTAEPGPLKGHKNSLVIILMGRL